MANLLLVNLLARMEVNLSAITEANLPMANLLGTEVKLQMVNLLERTEVNLL